jgi:hypothetical protein
MPNSNRRRRKSKTTEWHEKTSPRTKASMSDFAYTIKREREEAKRKHPVVVTQGCTCPRLCDVHPSPAEFSGS